MAAAACNTYRNNCEQFTYVIQSAVSVIKWTSI